MHVNTTNTLFKFIVLLISLTFLSSSCEKDTKDEEKPAVVADFRDSIIGTYTCIETYYGPIQNENNQIVWELDTVSTDTQVQIEIHSDSTSIIVSSESFSFVAPYESNGKYTCYKCGGPPDYAQFFQSDSIHVHRKIGAPAQRNYYGFKNP
tara:strand:+ start:19463 stop:19915 length:453 start_codon:yes stop_codon:yes gene_type:complete